MHSWHSHETVRKLGLVPFIALGVLLVPQTTQACDPDPCGTSDKWQSFQMRSEDLATNSVLLFDARRGPLAVGLTDAQAIAYLDAEVTADGQPITGSFEVEDGWRGVVWRPDAPFSAGAEISVTLTVDNDSIPDDGCVPSGLDVGPFVAQVSNGPMPALTEVVAESMGFGEIDPILGLDTLVCCDGAYPELLVDSCG